MIGKYNSAFRITYFGGTEIRHGNFMPTFKILQGQLHHAVDSPSLLPNTHEEPKFLQKYFTGNGELERRLSV